MIIFQLGEHVDFNVLLKGPFQELAIQREFPSASCHAPTAGPGQHIADAAGSGCGQRFRRQPRPQQDLG